MARSVINQEYTGDINIIRPPKFWSPTKILSDLGQEDIDELIDTGERTAWPKVEMVRTQTAISRALEAILARIDRGGADGPGQDRQSGGSGKSGAVRVDLGCARRIKKKKR